MEHNHFKLKSLLCIPLNKNNIYASKYYKNVIQYSDGIILDLQDGVKLEQKTLARSILKKTIDEFKVINPNIIIRINDILSDEYKKDLNAIFEQNILDDIIAIQPTCVETPESISELGHLTKGKLSIVIETPLGVINSDKLCSIDLKSVFIGVQDLSSCINIIPSMSGLHYAASKIIMSAAVKNVPVYGTIGDFANFKNIEQYKDILEFSKSLGITGSYAMNLDQVQLINNVYKLSSSQIKDYENILEKSKSHKNAVFEYNGKMYGPPIIRQIRKTLLNN